VRESQVTFLMRELDRLKAIQAVVDGDLKPGRAAERLGITVRQIERLVIRYRTEGPIGLVSRHRNRPGNRGLESAWADAGRRDALHTPQAGLGEEDHPIGPAARHVPALHAAGRESARRYRARL
jgi:Helix-turn-helix domain